MQMTKGGLNEIPAGLAFLVLVLRTHLRHIAAEARLQPRCRPAHRASRPVVLLLGRLVLLPLVLPRPRGLHHRTCVFARPGQENKINWGPGNPLPCLTEVIPWAGLHPNVEGVPVTRSAGPPILPT